MTEGKNCGGVHAGFYTCMYMYVSPKLILGGGEGGGGYRRPCTPKSGQNLLNTVGRLHSLIPDERWCCMYISGTSFLGIPKSG